MYGKNISLYRFWLVFCINMLIIFQYFCDILIDDKRTAVSTPHVTS